MRHSSFVYRDSNTIIEEVMKKLSSLVEMSEEDKEAIRSLSACAIEDKIGQGKNRRIITIACAYLISEGRKLGMTQKFLADKFDICESSIRNRARDMFARRGFKNIYGKLI